MTARNRSTASSWACAAALAVFVLPGFVSAQGAAGQAPATVASASVTQKLSLEQQEAFLKAAKVIRTRGVSKGVTGTLRATLTDGTLTHDASIQQIDESMLEFKSNRGVEFNFRDSWRYNVAAYRLDRLLELGMTPPSIERSHNGKSGAFTWWVDEVLMDEGQRLKTKASAPNSDLWNEQMWHVRLFDQLIYNVDRNLGNLLIDQSWKVWMIDHSRAFRLLEKVKTPGNLSKVDRRVFERLKALDQKSVKVAVDDYLTGPEIKSLLLRRGEIVALVEKAGPKALIDRSHP